MTLNELREIVKILARNLNHAHDRLTHLQDRVLELEMEMKMINIDFGNVIICDVCNEDYTNSNEHGGILWGNWAICPKCVHKFPTKNRAIKARCPAHLSFRDWVLTLITK